MAEPSERTQGSLRRVSEPAGLCSLLSPSPLTGRAPPPATWAGRWPQPGLEPGFPGDWLAAETSGWFLTSPEPQVSSPEKWSCSED